jgi:hypothetical protein
MTCRRDRDTGRFLIVGEHRDDCQTPDDCRGCVRCKAQHCVVCGKVHVSGRTCVECVAELRATLTEIPGLAAHLLDHALFGGHDGHLEAARAIPGGEAMVMLGPVADYDTWARRITVRLTVHYEGTLRGLHPDPWMTDDLPSDPEPPLLVLGFWEDAWRHHNQHLPGMARTVDAAVGYLKQHLARFAQEPAPSFADFAVDMGRLRGRLEAILFDGVRDEKGAPCVHCGTMLVRRTAAPRKPGPRFCRGHFGVCRWPPRWDLDECVRFDRGGLRDVWDCPRCKREYHENEYKNAVAAAYRAHAPALSADDLAVQVGVPKGSIYGWASTGRVRRRGRDLAGRVLYDVADVRRAANLEVA